MRGDGPLADAQSEAVAAGLSRSRSIEPVERFEDVLGLVLGDPWTIVLHAHGHAGSRLPYATMTGPLSGSEWVTAFSRRLRSTTVMRRASAVAGIGRCIGLHLIAGWV